MMNHMASKNKQRGFTLIEALVAFLILSVGMLGIASLQTVSLRSGQTAALRTVAVIKAGEILDRIRANPTQVLLYAASTGDTGVDNGCNTGVNICTLADMAADDIYTWKQSLTDALPNNAGTTASITVTPPGAGEVLTDVTVTINWEERSVDASSIQSQSYSVTTSLCGALLC